MISGNLYTQGHKDAEITYDSKEIEWVILLIKGKIGESEPVAHDSGSINFLLY